MTTRAWVAWAVTVAGLSLAVTNPLYLGLTVASVVVVGLAAPSAPGADSLRPLLFTGLGIVVFSVLIALLNGTPGANVVFTVPGPDAPSWLGGLRLGGPVTREGLVAAASRALALTAIFGSFAVLTTTITPARLLRATPAALFQAGLVLTIGLSILPSTIEDARQLREAEALRGRHLRWWHLPQLVPAIVLGGLEHSTRLAEALEARGFGRGSPGRSPFLAGALAPPALLLAAYLWLAGGDSQYAALVPGLLGTGGLAWWLRATQSANRSTRLNPEPAGPVDLIAVLLAAGTVAVALFLPKTVSPGLRYDPFTDGAAPPFAVAGALLPLAIIWPLAVLLVPKGSVPVETESVP